MKNKILRWVCVFLALAVFMPAVVSCNNTSDGEDTRPTDESTSEAVTDESEVVYGDVSSKENNIRVLIASDVHHTNVETWYGMQSSLRMRYWVEAIKKEHEEKPFDLIIIAGDTSLDHYGNKGSYTTSSVSTTKEFVDKYVSELPDGVPVYILPGNHEQFSNAQWKQFTGNDRQFAVEMKGNLFICLDNYNSKLEPYRTGDPDYTLTDVDYVKEQMEKHPDCQNVWLVAHHFDPKLETQEFKDIVKNDKRIKGLFAGHSHKSNIIDLGADFGNKKLAQTGNYSWNYYSATNTGTYSELVDAFWGFRDLVINDGYAMSQYIVAETKGPIVPLNSTNYPIDIKRKTVYNIRYY